MATICPYCAIEISESAIEAEDGCCPECGAVLAVRSAYDDGTDSEFDEDDADILDFDEDDDDFSEFDEDGFYDDDFEEDFDEEFGNEDDEDNY